MNPVVIFRHHVSEGPGFLGEFLDAHAIPWLLIAVDRGDAVPGSLNGFAGLVFMGGPMSVNDDLPWMDAELNLIRAAVKRDVPVLGHCLGAQLISKALGGMVTKNPVKEIGWGEVTVSDHDDARNWFGDVKSFQAFHWHGETFSLPDGAVRILSSAHCINQGYAIGPHLALQCHIEMTPEMVVNWCEVGACEIAASNSVAVQTAGEMQAQMRENLPGMQQIASRLYTKWIEGLCKV